MRNLNELNQYRNYVGERLLTGGIGGNENMGAFQIPIPGSKKTMRVIASAGHAGWDHVSVSLPKRCPTWEEMEHVKRLFFKDDEVAFQLHVTPDKHISIHPFCLHIWRPVTGEIPLPPSELVGPKLLDRS